MSIMMNRIQIIIFTFFALIFSTILPKHACTEILPKSQKIVEVMKFYSLERVSPKLTCIRAASVADAQIGKINQQKENARQLYFFDQVEGLLYGEEIAFPEKLFLLEYTQDSLKSI